MKTRFFTLVTLTLVITSLVTAQNVHIPDVNFKKFLLADKKINTNQDNEIQISEAEAFSGEIDCGFKKISDITGIEAFINLTVLRCAGNQLTALDVSSNTKLISLTCSYNQLATLDLSKNTNLQALSCPYNQLTTLNLSNNTKLTYFSCDKNQLSSLDLNKNTKLTYVSCYGNSNLVSLNVKNGNNSNFWSFNAKDNPNLTCIQVDDSKYSTTKWKDKDKQATFSEDCGYPSSPSTFEIVTIPDANFKAYLVGRKDINTNNDNEIQVSEAEAFSGAIECISKNISDLTGIEAFINITTLNCNNNLLTTLNVSENTALEGLFCSQNQLINIDVSNNTKLKNLECKINKLTNLNINSNQSLVFLICSSNKLKYLDVSNNTKLTLIDCNNNALTKLQLITNTNIIDLYCEKNKLSLLDLLNNKKLKKLYCNDNNLTNLDLHANTLLTDLECDNNQLTKLELNTNSKIERISCNNNNLTYLNLKNGNNNNIYTLDLKENNLSCIQVDNPEYSNSNWSDFKDTTACFNENCIVLKEEIEQQFIEGQTISDVQIKGENSVWYADKKLTKTLPTTTKLIHKAIYYVVNKKNETCQSYVLVITAISCNKVMAKPTGEIEQYFTKNQTISDLVVTGDNLVWYADLELNNKLDTTTKIEHNTTYYVRSENGICKSDVLAIKAIYKSVEKHFIDGQSLKDLVPNGEDLVWYADPEMTIVLSPDTKITKNTTYYAKSKDEESSKNDIVAIKAINCSDVIAKPIGEATQTFSDGQTISDLVVTGDNLVWYADKKLKTELPTDTELVNNTTYYVRSEYEVCKSDVLAIIVKSCNLVVTTPTGQNEQYFTNGQKIADLIVNGDNLVWYSDSSLTNKLKKITKLEHETTYYVRSEKGVCKSDVLAITAVSCNSVIAKPIGEATQTFSDGQTISDLVVTGDNLVWYADKKLKTELPTDTELVNNTTYYVRSEYEVCKSDVLVITVTQVVSRSDFDLYGFSFYPNPVNDILYFSSNSPIEKVVITNMLGQEVKVNLNSNKKSLDMSSLQNGNYLVKVIIEGISKTYKIIKK